jgi:hypothetical protein
MHFFADVRGLSCIGALIVSLATISTSATAAFNGEIVSPGVFDPAAPTVTVEDIEQYVNTRGRKAQARATEARRDEGLRLTRECAAKRGKPAVVPAPGQDATQTIRPDLRNKSLLELAEMYRLQPDDEVAAALRAKAAESSPGAGVPARSPPSIPPPPGNTAIARQMQEALDLQLAGADPAVQACMEEANRRTQDVAPKLNLYDSEVFEQAAKLLRQGRAKSVLVDALGREGNFGPAHRAQRFNVVLRGAEFADRAVSLDDAIFASFRADGQAWQDPPPVAAETPRRKPSGTDLLKGVREALDKVKELPR